MQVKDAMTSQVDYAAPEATLLELAEMMREDHVGAVPIASNEKMIGMVTDRDIVVRGCTSANALSEKTAQDVMTDELLWCFDDQSVETILENMAGKQIRRMPVVNRDKQLVGMVSLGDLAGHADAQHSGQALRDISAAA